MRRTSRDYSWPSPAEVATSTVTSHITNRHVQEHNFPTMVPPLLAASISRDKAHSACVADELQPDTREITVPHPSRQKINTPSVSKRIKTRLRTGFVEGQIGKLIAEAALHHDLADIPRMPEKALVGVSGDEMHSRDSYISIVNTAIDHARMHLKPGERHDYFAEANETPVKKSCHMPNLAVEETNMPPVRAGPQQVLDDKPPTCERYEVRTQNMADIRQRYMSETRDHRSDTSNSGLFKTDDKVNDNSATLRNEDKIDWRRPIKQPYKGGSFHGLESTKPPVEPKCHTFHATDRKLLQDRPVLRPVLHLTTQGEDISHILDAKLVSTTPLSSTTESEVFRSLSAKTRDRKLASKERRLAVVFGVTDEKKERFQGMGEQPKAGSCSIPNTRPMATPNAKLPATIPTIKPRDTNIAPDIPDFDRVPVEHKVQQLRQMRQKSRPKGPISETRGFYPAQPEARQYRQPYVEHDHESSRAPAHILNPQAYNFHPEIRREREAHHSSANTSQRKHHIDEFLPYVPKVSSNVEPTRTLSQFHRNNQRDKATYPGPTKFGDTHLIHQPPCDWQERNRRTMQRRTAEREARIHALQSQDA